MLLGALLFALTINSVTPQVINSSDDTVTVSANYSGSTTSQQYLQVAFTKENQTPAKYFGLTQNQDNAWYQYKSSPTLSDLNGYFYKFTPVSASWSGQLVAKMDINSEGYKGPGNYILKLFRHITAGGIESDNGVPVEIKVVLPTASVVTVSSESTPVSPNLTIEVSNSANLGEMFKINVNLKNFSKDTEYYLKLRGGPDESHITKMQTKNGGSYFSDNEGWENFPVIKTDSSGNWSGDIWGLLVEDKNEGNYKIKIRARKKETDTFSESGFKDLKFSKPAEIVIVATPAAVIKSVEKIATKSAVISVKKSTESAVLSSSISAEVLPPQENKKSQKANPLAVVLGVSGFFLLLFSVWGIIIKRYGSQ